MTDNKSTFAVPTAILVAAFDVSSTAALAAVGASVRTAFIADLDVEGAVGQPHLPRVWHATNLRPAGEGRHRHPERELGRGSFLQHFWRDPAQRLADRALELVMDAERCNCARPVLAARPTPAGGGGTAGECGARPFREAAQPGRLAQTAGYYLHGAPHRKRRQGAAGRPAGVTTSQTPPNPWMLWHFTSFLASWA
jgi:hypothetical protein